MKAENWKTVKDVLFDVLSLDPAQRVEYLNKNHLSGEVRTEIESLLFYSAESREFMSLPITDFSEDFPAFVANDFSIVGQKIGIYEIVEEIGCGGMGAAYLAQRTDGKFDQFVAIKMLRREFNTEKFRQIFRREREVQAKLNHPNIARLIDAGTTEDGIPFLVMEYVEGLPIDKFCEKENLSLNERLKLFNRVGDAVMHAHFNLTVHRDLKPSNIIVNVKNGPKLLDFGISKLLEVNVGESETINTIFSAMTPEYASPEQIRGEAVTTATDVYSLGVILYKMLTGRHPFDLQGKSSAEILEIITKELPIAPSQTKNVKNSQSAIRRQQLHGDLDNIALKALSKEPTQRYKTVEEFSADLWRHLDGLPVAARPATAAYRASKFFQRHRISAIAAVVVLFSLIGGIAVALWQAQAASAQANFALSAQKQAEAKEERAKKISDFMHKIIAYGSPHWSSGGAKYKGQTKVIDALTELGEQIDVEFAGQPDIQSEIHHQFASVYNFWTGDEFRKKERFHTLRAFVLHKQIYGEHHEVIAKDLFSVWNSLPTDDPRQAEILMQGINMMRATNPNNLNLPYMFEAYANRLTADEKIMRQSHLIEKNVRILAPDEVRELYRRAVFPATDENNLQIAEKMWREALPIYRFHYKEKNLPIYNAECKLSEILAKQKKWLEFEEHFGICKESTEKFVGDGWLDYYQKIEKLAAERQLPQ